MKRQRRGPGSYDRNLSAETRRDEQRTALVDAASHVFSRDGFVKASVASILEASGLSRGTFYRHFEDLGEVFLAVQKAAGDALVARIDAACREHADPAEQLRAAVGAYLHICAENGDLARVFHREALVSGREYVELRKRNLERIMELFRRGLSDAVARGTVREVPHDLTIYGVLLAIEGVALKFLEEHREADIGEALEPLLRLAGRAFT